VDKQNDEIGKGVSDMEGPEGHTLGVGMYPLPPTKKARGKDLQCVRAWGRRGEGGRLLESGKGRRGKTKLTIGGYTPTSTHMPSGKEEREGKKTKNDTLDGKESKRVLIAMEGTKGEERVERK
jgi:hypothetical protein